MLSLGTDAVAAAAQAAVSACSPDTAQTDKDVENIRIDNPRSLGVAWTVEDCDGTQTDDHMEQAGMEKDSDKGSANRYPEYPAD